MSGLLEHLSRQPPQPQTVLAFELKLLDDLGLAPQLEQTRLSPVARELAKALTHTDWQILGTLEPRRALMLELKHFLQAFLIYHLGKIPNARDAALQTNAAQ